MNHLHRGSAILMCLAAACEAQIHINLYNDSEVSDQTLAVAQKESSRILKDAGVSVSWCRRMIPGPACPTPGPSTLQVQLYPAGGEANYKVPSNALGVALTSTGAEFGFFAGVFTERVAAFVGKDRNNYGLMLGHVVAHEVGHLLTERSVHSMRGLMRHQWDGPEKALMATGRLLFSHEEAKLIREHVTARLQAAVPAILVTESASGGR